MSIYSREQISLDINAIFPKIAAFSSIFTVEIKMLSLDSMSQERL